MPGKPNIYTTKIIESVSMSVCMSGYAFRHALRYRAESGHIFEPGVKGHPGVNLH